jgi:hypothetical protein
LIAGDVRDRKQRHKLFQDAVFIGDTVISDLALLGRNAPSGAVYCEQARHENKH